MEKIQIITKEGKGYYSDQQRRERNCKVEASVCTCEPSDAASQDLYGRASESTSID